jgi:hypothetical protein
VGSDSERIDENQNAKVCPYCEGKGYALVTVALGGLPPLHFQHDFRMNPRGKRVCGDACPFELVRPAGRIHLEVKVLYTPGKGKC